MNNGSLPELPDEKDVKKRQAILIVIIVVLVAIGLSYAYLTNPTTQIIKEGQPPVEIEYSTPGKSSNPIQNWVLQNENRFNEIEAKRAKEKEENEAQLKIMMDQIANLEQQKLDLNQQLKNTSNKPQVSPPLSEIPLPPPGSLPVSPPQTMPMPGQRESSPQSDKSLMNKVMMTPDASGRIIKIKFTKKDKKNKPHIRDTIPAGSFGKAVLLSGLDAPTGGLAERNPHPVLLELIDHGSLPNQYRHKVKQCRVVASGTGNISDERAYLRLERFSCVLKNGEIISEVITGTVTGEDGKNGLRGNFVTKQGQLIANAFLAGSLSGIGNAIAQSYSTVSTSAQGTVTSIDPGRLAETGVASGLSNTMEKIADWYFKRAEETYPIIEISAGRIVNLFLTEDLNLNANLLKNHTPEDTNEL